MWSMVTTVVSGVFRQRALLIAQVPQPWLPRGDSASPFRGLCPGQSPTIQSRKLCVSASVDYLQIDENNMPWLLFLLMLLAPNLRLLCSPPSFSWTSSGIERGMYAWLGQKSKVLSHFLSPAPYASFSRCWNFLQSAQSQQQAPATMVLCIWLVYSVVMVWTSAVEVWHIL